MDDEVTVDGYFIGVESNIIIFSKKVKRDLFFLLLFFFLPSFAHSLFRIGHEQLVQK